MYCPHCRILTVNVRCPACLSRAVREPERGDWCFLAEKEKPWDGALTEILSQNGVPFLTESVLGAGLSARLGSSFERVRVYVPWERYETARELERGFFSDAYAPDNE